MSNSGRIYSCNEDIFWVQDAGQVVIVSESLSKSFLVQGLDAAIWSWLAAGYGFESIAGFLALSMHSTRSAAEQYLIDTLAAWSNEGILREGEI